MARKIKVFNLTIFLLIALCGAGYLVSMNNSLVKGFKLQELKVQAENMAAENENLTAQKTSLEAYNNLEQKVKDLNLVAVDKVEYFSVSSDLAKK